MKVTEVIETFYFLKNFLISVNATISFFDNSHFYWLSRFNRKTFHFPQVFSLIFDRSVWHNGKHPWVRYLEDLITKMKFYHFLVRFRYVQYEITVNWETNKVFSSVLRGTVAP